MLFITLSFGLVFLYKLIRIYTNITIEFKVKKPAITSENYFKDPLLFEKINTLHEKLNVELFRKELILFQPREGWCGQASVNSVIRSIDKINLNLFPILAWTSYPKPYSLNELKSYLL